MGSSTQAAYTKLLQGAEPFSGLDAQATPAPFVHAGLSVPPDVRGAPAVTALLGTEEMKFLKDSENAMLRPASEVNELNEL